MRSRPRWSSHEKGTSTISLSVLVQVYTILQYVVVFGRTHILYIIHVYLYCLSEPVLFNMDTLI